MSNDAMAALVMAECRPHVLEEDSLEDKCRKAFKVAKGHWMATDENDQFNGALVAVAEKCSEEDKERLRAEISVLKALNAAVSGVPVDFSAVLADRRSGYEAIGLNQLWREA